MINIVAGTRVTALITLLAVFAAGTGAPMPGQFNQADEDFPCRDHACGCVNAEICRTACCCFKPAKRTCCSAEAKPHEDAPVKAPSGGLLIGALNCKGVTGVWVALGLLVYPPDVSTPAHRDVRTFDLALSGEFLFSQWDFGPTPPPPRA